MRRRSHQEKEPPGEGPGKLMLYIIATHPPNARNQKLICFNAPSPMHGIEAGSTSRFNLLIAYSVLARMLPFTEPARSGTELPTTNSTRKRTLRAT